MERPAATVQAAAFDLDGLIFDTEAVFFRAARDYLADRGKEFTSEMMSVMIGRRAEEAGPALKRLAGLSEPPEVFMAELRALFFDRLDAEVQPLPGVAALLDHLDRREIPAGVATSSRRAYAERLLKNHNLIHRFVFILGAEDVSKGKPDPEIYLTAASRFAIEPRALVVFEDSPAGLSAARASGAYAVGVPHEHSPLDRLHDAHLIVPRLDHSKALALFEAVAPARPSLENHSRRSGAGSPR